MDISETAEKITGKEISRRDFIKTTAFLGGGAVITGAVGGLGFNMLRAAPGYLWGDEPYDLAKPENIIYSVCQQCNTQCGIKVKILDGVVAKIDGNPYSPWTLSPHLDYKTPLSAAAAVDGGICPKGHASIQTTYDPYRLVKGVKGDGS